MQRHLPFFLGALFVLAACSGGSNTAPSRALPPIANLGGTSNNPQQAAGAPKFTVVDLGANVFPYAINSVGEVVGATGTNPTKAFSYSNGSMHLYGTLPGDTGSAAADVNDSGEIVGTSSGADRHAVIFTSSAIVPLGSVPPYTTSSATGINNQGEIVGDGPNLGGGCGLIDSGIEFDGQGGATVLVPVGDVTAVNDAGVVVGGDCVDGENVLPWESTNSVSFPPNACFSDQHFFLSATDINDAGDVIGQYGAAQRSTDPFTCIFHGFLVKDNHTIDIPGPGGKTTDNTSANALNRSDWVVGIDGTTQRAIVYAGGTVYDLNSLLVGTGCSLWTLQSAEDINDSDVIVGRGLLGGTEHGFMLIPQH